MATCTAALLLGVEARAAADGAHFWLSTTASGSAGPEAPSLAMSEGEVKTLYLWGRPATGKQLRNVSLNVIASASGLDLKDGAFAVNNAINLSADRFEFVDDSSSSPALVSEYDRTDVDSGMTDALYGIGGFTLFPSGVDRGIGPLCTPGEMHCVMATDGEPAWVIASLEVDAVDAGTVGLSLQIGDLGLNQVTLADGDYDYSGTVDADDYTRWSTDYGSTTALHADGNGDLVVNAADYTVWRDHLGDVGLLGDSSATEARFGVDPASGLEPLHNAATNRGTNLPADDLDLTVTISPPSVSVPEPGSLLLVGLAALAVGARRSL